MRGAYACENCRQLKTTCDEQQPCKNCQNESLSCTYKGLPTKPLDNGSADIKELMTSFEGEIATLAGHNKSLECLLNKMQHQQLPKYDVLRVRKSSIPTDNEQQSLHRSRDDSEKMYWENAFKFIIERVPDEVEQNPGPPVEPGQSSLPAHHTARAGLLLQWPFINALTKDILLKESVDHLDDYPFSQEQWYNNLRLGGEGAVNTHKGSMLYVMGAPDFDPATVRKYVQSFKDNVLNMHPILLPSEVDDLATEFLSSLSKTAESAPPSRAGFLRSVGTETTEPRSRMGSKRKWLSVFEEENTESFKSEAFISRSVFSALALSMLALGKVCLHKTRIPDLVSEFDALTQPYSQLECNDGSTSCPYQESPPKPLSVQACDPPLPREADHMISRRVSPQDSEKPSSSRYIIASMDAIPGLEYYSLAADVFGSQLAGSSLKHVYVSLFLGLYQGQLGCVMESWSYIALAGRALQVVLRPSLSRLRQLKEEPRVKT